MKIVLPNEKLDWFRLNKNVSKEYEDCSYCAKVRTRGRDNLGFSICEKCLLELHDKAKGVPR